MLIFRGVLGIDDTCPTWYSIEKGWTCLGSFYLSTAPKDLKNLTWIETNLQGAPLYTTINLGDTVDGSEIPRPTTWDVSQNP